MPSENPPPNHVVHPALVLGVYGEELANGSRAAIFGDATLGLAEELVLRGARLVHVYDTDAARVAEATARAHERSIFYGTLPDSGDVGVRDGAFDLVVVPDLSFATDTAALLAVVRRVLSAAGAALIASPNGDASSPLIAVAQGEQVLGYYELYEAVAEHFSHVRMLGQAPFVGYAVAEFSVEDPEPTIDTSLAETEAKEPDWFIVLASDRTIRLDPFALIELPRAATIITDAAERADKPGVVSIVEAMPASGMGGGTVLVNILEAEREAAIESLRQQEQASKEQRVRADQTAAELTALREELVLLRLRCESTERRLEEEEARRSSVEVLLERSRHNPELAELRERVRRLDAASDGLTEEHGKEIAGLETMLRDRGREVQELRGEVDRRDKLVRELVMNPPPPPTALGPASNGHDEMVASLSARLDRLATEAATREADLQAARWKIAVLEREQPGPR